MNTPRPSQLGDHPTIDWANISSCEIECHCRMIYRSQCKMVSHEGSLIVVTRVECPGCGKSVGHVRVARSDLEQQEIQR